MAIKIYDRLYNNRDEQIEKNREDIKELQERDTGKILVAGENIILDETEDTITISATSEIGGGNVDDVLVNGVSVVTNKVAIIDLTHYALINDVYNKANTYNKDEVDNLILGKANTYVVSTKPSDPESNTTYYVGSQAPYQIYYYDTDKTEAYLGNTDINLSNYYTKTEINTLLGDKVDKVSSASVLYGTNNGGNQTTYPVSKELSISYYGWKGSTTNYYTAVLTGSDVVVYTRDSSTGEMTEHSDYTNRRIENNQLKFEISGTEYVIDRNSSLDIPIDGIPTLDAIKDNLNFGGDITRQEIKDLFKDIPTPLGEWREVGKLTNTTDTVDITGWKEIKAVIKVTRTSTASQYRTLFSFTKQDYDVYGASFLYHYAVNSSTFIDISFNITENNTKLRLYIDNDGLTLTEATILMK